MKILSFKSLVITQVHMVSGQQHYFIYQQLKILKTQNTGKTNAQCWIYEAATIKVVEIGKYIKIKQKNEWSQLVTWITYLNNSLEET